MPTLLLIKHARPEQFPDRPPQDWPLSEAGRSACLLLAEKLRPHRPAAIVSSDELKASETATLLAQHLNLSAPDVRDDLHEHDRTHVPLMRTADFISSMANFFKHPRKLVLGHETAEEALARFESALTSATTAHKGAPTLAVVTHGTVLALYLEKRAGIKPFDLWRRMGLPSFIALDDAGKVIDEVDAV